MNADATNNPNQFLALLRPIQRDLEVYCRRLVWQANDVNDVLQNAVMRGFACFDRYNPEASFRAWMFKILTREAFAANRKHARIARHEFQLEPEELAALSLEEAGVPSGQGLGPADINEALEPAVLAGLKTLTDTERAVLLLRAVGEMRYREISEALDIPIGSVMGNLSRARQKMRGYLGRSARGNNSFKGNDV